MIDQHSIVRTARALNRQSGNHRILPALFFFTDDKRLSDPRDAIAALPRHCGVVFRHYESVKRALLAKEVVKLCRSQHRICLIAGSRELAVDSHAHGVHWPEYLYGSMPHRSGHSPINWISTTSVHSAAAVSRLDPTLVSAAFLSPIFPTESHTQGAATLGPVRVRPLIRQSRVPIYLLGGLNDRTAPRVAQSGATGLAAIGGLLGR